jgi:hypothetical protein
MGYISRTSAISSSALQREKFVGFGSGSAGAKHNLYSPTGSFCPQIWNMPVEINLFHNSGQYNNRLGKEKNVHEPPMIKIPLLTHYSLLIKYQYHPHCMLRITHYLLRITHPFLIILTPL